MGHWAKIDNDNIVTEVLVADDDAHDWLVETFGGEWVQTSYNTYGGVHYDPETREPSADQSKAFRYNYAGIGDTFMPELGENGGFVKPKPYSSWILDEATGLWVAPISEPSEDGPYRWDEETQSWNKAPASIIE